MFRAVTGRGRFGGWKVRSALVAQGGINSCTRGMAAVAGSRLGEVVDLAAKAKPLKDSIKYIQTTDEKLLIWSNLEMKKHTDAFANGILEGGFQPGDKIAVWLPLGSVEYLVVVLGAAKAGVTVISIDPPEDRNVASLEPVKEALKKYSPKGLVVWGEYSIDAEEMSGIDGIFESLFPKYSHDPSLRATFTKSTGTLKAPSADYPSLEIVVHTGPMNLRGAINLKSLLSYSSPTSLAAVDPKQEVLISASSGKAISHSEFIQSAAAKAKALKLTGDQDSKTGKLLMKKGSAADANVVEGAVASMMSQTLFISPSYFLKDEEIEETADRENAVVFA